MSRCRYCGDRFIGNRDGLGMHLSSAVITLATAAGSTLVILLLRAI